jgi:8-oxo-dGTP diphosphatase
LQVLLIERGGDPFNGCWALPGGYVEVTDDGDQGESLENAARRELYEETGLSRLESIYQFFTFGDPGRDPRGRVISVAYLVAVDEQEAECAQAGSDAAKVRWFDVTALPAMAFDHDLILASAVTHLRGMEKQL